MLHVFHVTYTSPYARRAYLRAYYGPTSLLRAYEPTTGLRAYYGPTSLLRAYEPTLRAYEPTSLLRAYEPTTGLRAYLRSQRTTTYENPLWSASAQGNHVPTEAASAATIGARNYGCAR